MSNADVLDTRFRSALRRMAERGRLRAYAPAVDPALEIAAIMKAFDTEDAAILFADVKGFDVPVIVVDHDIDIRDRQDVEYALATRMEASRYLIVIPQARGHEYVRTGDHGVIAKLGIDATVPFADQARFARYAFAPTAATLESFSQDSARIRALLDL